MQTKIEALRNNNHEHEKPAVVGGRTGGGLQDQETRSGKAKGARAPDPRRTRSPDRKTLVAQVVTEVLNASVRNVTKKCK